ncbi:D-alanyl-D-alanine carboxypeptidase/D-alanyl-D-alanine-endopeptidase [Streptomyces polyrhachis]|uniref:D-alanyl-D-alanine carboxypeptidase/D-alanyl-D-alanine-endopeptidase n=1 Tax=Streptomyces polyrhachis TaxID=1282885 RepID=A0ABW2GKP1_9ACTN
MLGRRKAGAPPSPWRLTALSALSGLALAAVTASLAGPWDNGQRTAERARAAAVARAGDADHDAKSPRKDAAAPRAMEHPPREELGEGAAPGYDAPAVLRPLGPEGHRPTQAAEAADGTATRAPLPTEAGLRAALRPLLADPALGSLRSAAVWDVASGRGLYGARPHAAAVPASVTKLATGAAALGALGPEHRIATETRTAGRTLYLVGGGDPTLTGARLDRLAELSARALKPGGKPLTLRYDTAAYTGPARHPIGVNDNLAAVTPLMVDEGRLDGSYSGPAPRTPDPAGEAARLFARHLADHGVKLTGAPTPATAPAKAGKLAAVHSAPLGVLVERMLTHSDNDLAEALARQSALATGRPASFSSAAAAVRARLARMGLPVKGVRFADGSGISRGNRAPAAFYARLLVLAGHPDHPELRPLLTGLPIAGFSGTLDARYDQTPGAGVVRAKTGTLTGVNSLAGTVVDADGRLLAFAFLANGTTDRDGAQRALDKLASALADCGCR